MTALGDLLIARIARTGPISLADYMTDCLMHPQHGYYATRDPFGAAGDFTTAPEISQMFGELIGLALAQAWIDQGQPAQITLAELGPGRGTLMQDALRATSGVPGFHAALSVHLVETSPTLRKAQGARIPDATWHDSIATLPDAPLYLIANEFFDALPIRQFIRSGDGWREKMVGVSGGALTFGLSAAAPIATVEHRLTDTTEGDLVEICPSLPAIVETIGAQIEESGGCALIADYGDWVSQGDTLQALQAQSYSDPLATPGEADLTAHVDFAAIAAHAGPAKYTRLTPQGVFLERLGITARAQALGAKLAGEARTAHIAAHRRLTHPAEMGDLFKVLGLYPTAATPPPGLEP
ncbi:ATP synthase subunit beta [Loktanella sp. 5RATIMAR09]|uniref:class I SAM-dependent methyltransferase n=1 Tax=Loktanella sp. 5RATIMAR09 TaxID=1225655 RepID=UPI0006EBDB18|nr:SAM-dependent methyltransferase [Loktanella sp. 5RATIMAR09]KQI72035.1 ATP synthase subunit beta [Loktanella sp. 5RATIMAR09]